MDSRDRLRLRLVGTNCGACGRPYPAAGIRVLAQREDLAFVLLHCSGCSSDGLGLLTDGEPAEEAGSSSAPADWRTIDRQHGEFTPGDELRLGHGRPVDGDDLLAVHAFLAGYAGDARGLLGEAGPRTGKS